MVVHQTECQYSDIAFKNAQGNEVHACYKSLLVFKQIVLTETVTKQMVESGLFHISYRYFLSPHSPSSPDIQQSQEMTATKIDIIVENNNLFEDLAR
mgnify:CR=1 FL=1